MIPREILKKIRQIEIRTNRLVSETLAAPSFQPVAQVGGISCAVPDSQHLDLVMFQVDREVNRVRPRRWHFGLVRPLACEWESLRLLRQRVENLVNGVVQLAAQTRLALIIPRHSLLPVPLGSGFDNDHKSHFLPWRRSLISAKTCLAGFPRPGFFSASSARRSSSAICSGVSVSSKSPNSISM